MTSDRQTTPAPAVSLILPCFNEEENFDQTVRQCTTALGAFFADYEIIVVDDASTDGTPAIAARAERDHPHLRVIRNPVNLGAGTSLWVGMQIARGAIVIHDSMDYPFHIQEDLPRVMVAMESADVVVVVRIDRSAHSQFRKITSLVHHFLVRVLFRPGIRDLNFVQAYRREVIHRLRVKARSPAFVTPELLIRAVRAGFRVVEVEAPFHRRTRGAANYGKARDILWALADMLSLWLEGRSNASV